MLILPKDSLQTDYYHNRSVKNVQAQVYKILRIYKNNKKIKEYAKLIQKKERDKTNLFLVEGEHMVKEAFNANALQELFILEGLECPIEFNYETVTQQVLNK